VTCPSGVCLTEKVSLHLATVENEARNAEGFLELARAGEVEAFGEVCREYETRLLCQAMKLCGNPSLAQDLAQDTLVEAWKHLNRYNGQCRFFTWLCAILLNRYRNVLREKRRLPFLAAAKDPLDQLMDKAVLPDESAELREEARVIQKCLQALPPKHRQVIYLRFFVDNSLEGIAAALNCSVGTVKSRLFHALEKFRAMKALNKERPGPAPEIHVI
jgi:RNA polymerase sigma-70 factor, ECF subfamily